MTTESADLRELVLSAWRTHARITAFLVERLPEGLWSEKVPGAPRRTVRMILGHVHNARRMWIITAGGGHGIRPPEGVDRHRVEPEALLTALGHSARGIEELLAFGLDRGGRIPGYPPDVVHFLTYCTGHEAHHRGQVVMLARALGHRLPSEITNGLWHFSRRAKEVRAG